jgi:hypothetical protein
MARFRDSHGRFSSRPRDSAGRYRSAEWYNRSQGQKARYKAQSRARAQAEAAETYSEHRAREIAAEYEAAAARYEAPGPAAVPAGPELRQRQDAWGLQEIGSVQVEPGAHVSVKIDLGGRTVYEFDGRADEFAPMELRRALDEWSVEYLDDDAHYWRAPELRIWQIDKTLNPQTLQATSVTVRAVPGADAILQEDIDTHGAAPMVLTGEAAAPVEWPEDDDALPA